MTSAPVRVVDADQPRHGDRQQVAVAVGILVDLSGRFLMTTRPPGKAYADYWEFPGGKLEGGESVAQALRRELQEEIGVTIGEVVAWREESVDYPHAWVKLSFCRVYDWSGELVMHEGQRARWCRLDDLPAPVLPGSVPVLDWMAEQPEVLSAPGA